MATLDQSDTSRWLSKAAAGDSDGWRELLARNHDRLRRMVALRLDPRLQGRVDPSDVLQDVYIDAAGHLAEYVQNPSMPFYLWTASCSSAVPTILPPGTSAPRSR